jgi:hypothetical protein
MAYRRNSPSENPHMAVFGGAIPCIRDGLDGQVGVEGVFGYPISRRRDNPDQMVGRCLMRVSDGR